MTAEFRYMMHLAGCAALGKQPESPREDVDWEQVLAFAKEQAVLPLVQYALKRADFVIPEEIRKGAVQQLSSLTMRAFIRRVGVLQVLAELERQGIRAAVLKGFAVARDYAQPDVRISGDADIYISEADEEKALAVFAQAGFTYQKRRPEDKDTALRHPRYGTVELHVRLFDDVIIQVWHDGKPFELLEEYRQVKTPDGAYNTLGETDHFLFVLEHTMKHLIGEEFSLRMVLDVGVLLAAHGKNMDHDRIEEFLVWRRYGRALQAFRLLLNTYCGFSLDAEPGSDEAMEALVCHMEQTHSGSLAKANQEELWDGLRIYNAELRKKGGRSVHKWAASYWQLYRLLFPTMDSMKEKYPCLKRCPLLYPFVWLYRLVIKGLGHVLRRDVNMNAFKYSVEEEDLGSQRGSERARLLRQLEMM